MKVEGERLETRFLFKLKKMDYDTAGMNVKDSKLEIVEILEKKQYSGFGGSPNQEGIKQAISKVLEQVKFKSIV